MHKITEIIPDSMPDWAKDAMDEGQFFRMTLERISSLEAELKEREDAITEHNEECDRLCVDDCVYKKYQNIRFPDCPKDWMIPSPPVTGSNDK